MRRRLLALLFAITLLGAPALPLHAQDLNFNHTSIKGLAQAYGFVFGQQFTLSRIAKEYPELAPSVTLAQSQFDASFPRITVKLHEQLAQAMGNDVFNRTAVDIKHRTTTELQNQSLTSDTAKAFIHMVKGRATGNIDSPVLEYLLSVMYLKYPAQEFLDNYRQRFTSDGHSKALGVNVALQLPISWKAKEGERPHIVQKWVSQNGTGLEMIHLDIRDADGYTPTPEELEDFISSGEVKDILPDGATYIDAGSLTLEMQHGYWTESSFIQSRAGSSTYLHTSINQIFFRGKVIGLMCQAMRPSDQKALADAAFTRIKPLCQQVLNSLVLMQAY